MKKRRNSPYIFCIYRKRKIIMSQKKKKEEKEKENENEKK